MSVTSEVISWLDEVVDSDTEMHIETPYIDNLGIMLWVRNMETGRTHSCSKMFSNMDQLNLDEVAQGFEYKLNFQDHRKTS